MKYERTFIEHVRIPHARNNLFQHVVDTYASEANKTATIWAGFDNDDLDWKPHAKSTSVIGIMKHQLLSERRFFSEFLGRREPAVQTLLPEQTTITELVGRLVSLSVPRLEWLAGLTETDWLTVSPFFDEERERIWIFWRRVLHTAHHRTQLGIYLRMLDKPLPPTYGPTADRTWEGADPTTTRRSHK